jgi:hypothetical protein
MSVYSTAFIQELMNEYYSVSTENSVNSIWVVCSVNVLNIIIHSEQGYRKVAGIFQRHEILIQRLMKFHKMFQTLFMYDIKIFYSIKIPRTTDFKIMLL